MSLLLYQMQIFPRPVVDTIKYTVFLIKPSLSNWIYWWNIRLSVLFRKCCSSHTETDNKTSKVCDLNDPTVSKLDICLGFISWDTVSVNASKYMMLIAIEPFRC